jgi:pilus assembly protein CpaB
MREPLAAQLSRGYRALTIQVDQVTSLAGQLAPGDQVDLLYSRGESAATTIAPLLEGVRILATGADTDASPANASDVLQAREFSTVTLLVTAEDAARIVLAEQTGRITVLLRQSGDAVPVDIRIRDSRQLLRAANVGNAHAGALRIELITGGRGEVEPARTWLVVGSKAGSGEAM